MMHDNAEFDKWSNYLTVEDIFDCFIAAGVEVGDILKNVNNELNKRKTKGTVNTTEHIAKNVLKLKRKKRNSDHHNNEDIKKLYSEKSCTNVERNENDTMYTLDGKKEEHGRFKFKRKQWLKNNMHHSKSNKETRKKITSLSESLIKDGFDEINISNRKQEFDEEKSAKNTKNKENKLYHDRRKEYDDANHFEDPSKDEKWFKNGKTQNNINGSSNVLNDYKNVEIEVCSNEEVNALSPKKKDSSSKKSSHHSKDKHKKGTKSKDSPKKVIKSVDLTKRTNSKNEIISSQLSSMKSGTSVKSNCMDTEVSLNDKLFEMNKDDDAAEILAALEEELFQTKKKRSGKLPTCDFRENQKNKKHETITVLEEDGKPVGLSKSNKEINLKDELSSNSKENKIILGKKITAENSLDMEIKSENSPNKVEILTACPQSTYNIESSHSISENVDKSQRIKNGNTKITRKIDQVNGKVNENHSKKRKNNLAEKPSSKNNFNLGINPENSPKNVEMLTPSSQLTNNVESNDIILEEYDKTPGLSNVSSHNLEKKQKNTTTALKEVTMSVNSTESLNNGLLSHKSTSSVENANINTMEKNNNADGNVHERNSKRKHNLTENITPHLLAKEISDSQLRFSEEYKDYLSDMSLEDIVSCSSEIKTLRHISPYDSNACTPTAVSYENINLLSSTDNIKNFKNDFPSSQSDFSFKCEDKKNIKEEFPSPPKQHKTESLLSFDNFVFPDSKYSTMSATNYKGFEKTPPLYSGEILVNEQMINEEDTEVEEDCDYDDIEELSNIVKELIRESGTNNVDIIRKIIQIGRKNRRLVKVTEEEIKFIQSLDVEVPFTPPALHSICLNLTTRPTASVLDALHARRIKYCMARFMQKEDDVIKSNFVTFCQHHKIPQNFRPFLKLTTTRHNKSLICIPKRKLRKFLQFLACGLDDRFLYAVYKRFRALYSLKFRGKFSDDELDATIKYMEIYGKCHNHFSKLALFLNRDRSCLEKKYLLIKNMQHLNENRGKKILLKPTNENVIRTIMKVTNKKKVDDLRNHKITKIEWSQIASQLDAVEYNIRKNWKRMTYVLLFSTIRDINEIQRKLVNLIYDKGYDEIKEIKFDKFLEYFPGCTESYLQTQFRNVLKKSNPKATLRATLESIRETYKNTTNTKVRKMKDITIIADNIDNELQTVAKHSNI